MEPNELISKLNDPRLRSKIQEIAASPQGKALMNQIDQADKQALLQKIQSLNNSNITAELLLRQLNSNPGIVNQLKNILK